MERRSAERRAWPRGPAHLLVLCALLAACEATGPEPPGQEAPRVPLREVAAQREVRIGIGAAAGRYFGATTGLGVKYNQVLAREFNVLTPENDMKHERLQPSRGVFDFTRADAMVEFAEQQGMKVRGHTLVWHNQNASWLADRSWTAEEAAALLDEHVTTVVGRYRGRVAAWDVVNEAVDDRGVLRPTPWAGGAGRSYIEQAFRAARAADPDALLFYNDYSLEWPGPKQDSVFALLRDLRERGVPVDGIGFQGHFEVGGGTPSRHALRVAFDRFAALGLRVHVTELDIRVPVPATAGSLQTQAQNYRDVFEVCAQTPACDMVVTWGFTDLDSWVPGHFPGKGAALLFDASIEPKPAYWAVHDLLSGM